MKDGRQGRDHRLETLAARRWRVAIVLTIAMMATYFGFLLVVGYDKPVAGALIVPGLSWGIALGVIVIGVAWAVTGIYVYWANKFYDTALASLQQQRPREGPEDAT
jgi:uncharacterized membrane protein (DUF485 family)